MVGGVQVCLPSLTHCFLSDRKVVIHRRSREIFVWRSSGTIVLNAELKSMNRILAKDPQLSRCWRIKCRSG